MNELEVFFSRDSERVEFEYELKGYRSDVYVRKDKCFFNLIVYDPVRLCQTFDDDVASQGYYSIDHNLILVKEVNKKEILFTIQKLDEEDSLTH